MKPVARSYSHQPPYLAFHTGHASDVGRIAPDHRCAGAVTQRYPASARGRCQSDPLASWNDGPTKQSILDFVRATTDPTSPKLVPPEERVATFDQDGTLWVEHPIYSQFIYCLDRVPAVVKAKPALAKVEPFKTVLSGDREAIANLQLRGLEEIAGATLSGMTVDEFDAEVQKWHAAAKHPRWKRPYTDLTYQPMQEVMSYLRANGYKTYIVTGGGQDFVRQYSDRVRQHPPPQVVGTAGGTNFDYDKDGWPFLTKDSKFLLNDDNAGKPESIHLHDRAGSGRRVWQFDRRPADAGIHWSQ